MKWVVGAASAVALFVAVLVLTAILCWSDFKGNDSASATIRNLGVVVGGLVAIVLGWWRMVNVQRQVDVAEQEVLDRQFQSAAEMLGHEEVSVRMCGVTSLYYLGDAQVERYGKKVAGILQRFSEAQRRNDRDDGFSDRLEARVMYQELRKKLVERNLERNAADVRAAGRRRETEL